MQNPASRLQKHLLRSRIALFSFALPMLAFSLLHFGGGVLRVVYVLLGFSLIIFFHELGHFVVARMCSVKCLAFSLGIGPRAFGYRKGGGLSFGRDPYDPEANAKKKADEKALSDLESGKTTIQTEKGPVEIQPDTKNLTSDILGKSDKDKEASKHRLEHMEAATTHSDLPTSAEVPPHPRQMGDCDYRVSWLPLGGYVRMLGQDDMDPTKISTDPHAFNQRPIWQRMCIVSAGVIMNIIFAFVAFSIIFKTSGVKFPTADIGQVTRGMPADGKLQLGDKVVAIDGKYARDGGFIEYTDLVIASALSSGEREIRFDYLRDGKPGYAMIKPVRIPGEPFLMIGVSSMPSLNITASQDNIDDNKKLHTTPVTEGGYGNPADADEIAKLHPGEVITAIDGQPVSSYLDLYSKVQELGAKPVEISLHDPKGQNVDHSITVTPTLTHQPGAPELPTIFGMSPRAQIRSVAEPDRFLWIFRSSPMPAATAGMKADDEIVSINNRRWPTVDQFRDVITHSAGKELDVVVQRDGNEVPLKVTPVQKKGTFIIGVQPGEATDDLAVVPREGGSGPAADVLGPNAEMRISSVDGQSLKDWWDIIKILKTKNAGDKVTFAFTPVKTAASEPAAQTAAAITKEFTVDEALVKNLATQTHYMLNLPVDVTQQIQRANTIPDAAMMGVEHTEKFIGQVYMTLAGLIRHTVPADNLHGIVGIGYIGYQVQERGMSWFWYLMAMISVNLAVANFLPLPIVDGGLFLLLILEKIRGKPLSLKVQSAIQVVGIVLLAGMFLFVTFNDLQLFGK